MRGRRGKKQEERQGENVLQDKINAAVTDKRNTGKRKERPDDCGSGITPEEKVIKMLAINEEEDEEDDVAVARQLDKEYDADECDVCEDDPNMETGSKMMKRIEENIRMMREKEEKMVDSMADLSKIGEMDSKMNELIRTIGYVSETMAELKRDLDSMKKVMKKQEYLEAELSIVKKHNSELKEKINDMENYSRRDNIEIAGVKENTDESVKDICKAIFRDKIGISHDIDIVRCHRLGNQTKSSSNKKPRKIIVRFGRFQDKEEIMKKKRLLKGTGIFLSDNLSIESQRKQTTLVPILKKVREIEPKAHFRGDKIFYRGRLYTEKNVHELPIDPHLSCTKSKGGVTIFSGKFSKLSNLNQCNIVIDGQSWSSIEQYMQYKKALSHGENQIAAQIAATNDPYEAMHLAKKIETELSSWKDNAADIMERAMRIKFSSPVYKMALKQTEKIIGESTQHREWGTGYSIGHENAFKARMWTGENWTGKLLSKVKATI